MRSKGPKVPPAASLVPQFYAFLGPQVRAGTYTVRLTKGTKEYEGTISAVMDPRADYTDEDMALQDETVMRLYHMLARLTYLVDSLLDVQEQAKDRVSKVGGAAELSTKLDALIDELETFRKTLVATRKGGFIAGEEQLREKIGSLYGTVNGFEGRPTDSQVKYMGVLDGLLRDAEAKLESMLSTKLGDLNTQLRERNLDPITRMSKETWEAKDAGR